MAKLDDVIRQLQSELPKYTDDFHTINVITNASIDAGVMTLTLEDENVEDTYINVLDLKAELSATGVDEGDVDGEYDISFDGWHDQTLSYIEKAADVEKYLTFVGDFEGSCLLKDVPNNNTVTIESDSEPTGDFRLLENLGYSGRKSVTWTDSQTLTYDVDFDHDPNWENGVVQSNIRIDGVSSDADIVNLLENNAIRLTKNTLFVVMNEASASKSRFTYSDAYNRKEYKDDLAIEVVQTISLYAVIPTQTYTTPRTAINYIYELRPYLIKSLHGSLFDTGFIADSKFLTTYLGDAGEQYNKSYYVHRFDFETVWNIERDDSLDIQDTRAFRTFEIDLKMEFDDYEDVKKSIEGIIE